MKQRFAGDKGYHIDYGEETVICAQNITEEIQLCCWKLVGVNLHPLCVPEKERRVALKELFSF